MAFQDLPIKKKVMAVVMLTSITALVLTAAAFTVYDSVTYRQTMVSHLSTTASIIADNSTAALAFKNETDAEQVLGALRADPHIVAAALYDDQGNLYVHYPTNQASNAFPVPPGKSGHQFGNSTLIIFQPVVEGGAWLGTLYLQSDLGAFYTRLRLYGGIALLVLAGSLLVAFLISSALQERISDPILALTNTAKLISTGRDYSMRAQKVSGDEVGLLTDAFNQMLVRIQEQTEAVSFLAAIVHSSDDAIVGKDLHSRVVSWNAGAERMFGYTAAEMLGQLITRLVSPDRPDEEPQILREATQGKTRRFETVRIHKNGRPIDVSMAVSPVYNASGEIIGISSIARDITERRRAEEQFRLMNVELEQRVEDRTAELTAANKEMEAFTYSVAHDLRAPLRHIDAFTRILHDDFAAALPAEARRYLENIRNGSRNMSHLVDDLLNLARLGRQALKRQPTALGGLVKEVMADLNRDTEGREIEWRIQPLPTVECDSGLMKQVYANLLANAIKYTRPRPHAVIEVGCRKVNGDTALFVSDNGVGFNMKYADKLFGVFQRLHRPEEFEGTGVGLATVDRIIRKHGGKIWAEAAENKGATFYFTLGGVEQPGRKLAAGPNN
jgi:PAS domain S-box-containing protein